MHSDAARLYGFIIPLLAAIAVIAMRNRRPRRLRLEAMWVRPAIFVVLVGLTFATAVVPTDPLSITILMLAVAVGVGAGWMRGKLMHIEVHPETHDITVRASPAGMVFILAVLGVRMAIRNTATATSVAGIPAAALIDALILFAAAMMITQSVEMFLRARRRLAEARSAADPGNRPIVT